MKKRKRGKKSIKKHDEIEVCCFVFYCLFPAATYLPYIVLLERHMYLVFKMKP